MRFTAIPTQKTHRAHFVVIALVAFCQFAPQAHAGIHYVATWGNDARTKIQTLSRSTPWKSIQHAVNQLEPGDQIRVLDGQYREHIWIPKSGLSDKWVSVVSDTPGGAKITGSITGNSLSYVLIRDLDITNPSGDFVQTKGISFTHSHHITIRGNTVHDCFGGGISCDQSDSIVIDWNLVYNNAFWDPGQHSGISIYQPQKRGPQDDRFWGIVVRNNTSYGNYNLVNSPYWGAPSDGNGIVIDDTQNLYDGGNGVTYPRYIVVENNLSFDNGGQGVHCHQSAHLYIRNNTCVNNLGNLDFGGEVAIVQSQDVMVYNNVLDPGPQRNAALQYQSTGYWFAYNLVDGPLQSIATGRGNRYGDPRFAAGSFQLLPDSPAINAALTQNGLFPWDVVGNPRIHAGALDMGASEYIWWNP